MSNSTNQNEVITQYLLGTLSEIERERLDELSVTSQEFVESLRAIENDLVDSWLQRELSGTMLAQFESHYMASPIRRGRVEFAEALQVFAGKQTVFDDSSIRGAADPGRKRKGGWLSTLSIFGGGYPGVRWGLAVTAVVVIAAGAFLLVKTVRLRQEISIEQARRDELQQREMQLQKELDQQRASNAAMVQELAQVREDRARMEEELKQSGQLHTGGTAIASFVLTPQMRGVGQPQSVSISGNTGHVTMQLNLEPNDYQAYRVALIDQSNHQVLWQSGKLSAHSGDRGKSVSVSFSSGLLKAQTYVMQLSGVSASGNIEVMSDYPFKVVK